MFEGVWILPFVVSLSFLKQDTCAEPKHKLVPKQNITLRRRLGFARSHVFVGFRGDFACWSPLVFLLLPARAFWFVDFFDGKPSGNQKHKQAKHNSEEKLRCCQKLFGFLEIVPLFEDVLSVVCCCLALSLQKNKKHKGGFVNASKANKKATRVVFAFQAIELKKQTKRT